MKTVLTIAGTDPSGGAGLQADLKTFAAHGVYGMGVVTALVAQNTRGVTAVEKISRQMLEAQLEAVFSDIFPDAVKIGMIRDDESVATIAAILKKYRPKNVVLDTVMVSSSGHRLLKSGAERGLTRDLIPLCDLITPNLPETEALCGFPIRSATDADRAAREIARRYAGAILIKGGHSAGNACDDILYFRDERMVFEGRRVETKNAHGTGCALSAAIASNLAQGSTLPDAVREAKDFVTGALSWGLSLGHGNGPIHHGWRTKPDGRLT